MLNDFTSELRSADFNIQFLDAILLALLSLYANQVDQNSLSVELKVIKRFNMVLSEGDNGRRC